MREKKPIDHEDLIAFLQARIITRTDPDVVPDNQIWISDASYDELMRLNKKLNENSGHSKKTARKKAKKPAL